MDKTIGILVSALVVSMGLSIMHCEWERISKPRTVVVSEQKPAQTCDDVMDETVTMPPGFILVTNAVGEWRAAYEDTGSVMRPFSHEADGTRQQAVIRAWEQYTFQHETDPVFWHKAN